MGTRLLSARGGWPHVPCAITVTEEAVGPRNRLVSKATAIARAPIDTENRMDSPLPGTASMLCSSHPPPPGLGSLKAFFGD